MTDPDLLVPYQRLRHNQNHYYAKVFSLHDEDKAHSLRGLLIGYASSTEAEIVSAVKILTKFSQDSHKILTRFSQDSQGVFEKCSKVELELNI